MTLRLHRRVALCLPLLLASCGGEDAPAPVARRDFPPLRYSYLPPISLNVQRVETAEGFIPPSGDDEVSGLSPVNLGDTLFAMARDRLKPVATTGVATFRILTASITRRGDTLNGVLAVRLDVSDGDGGNSGYVEARATAIHSGPIDDLRGTLYDMAKSMMSDMNVELEYQLRNKLRTWIVEPPAAPSASPPAATPGPSTDQSSPLPPPPPAPPRS